MAFIKALDVSRYQLNINWSDVKAAGYEIAIIKMSGGDDGLYYDSKATQNYYAAKAAGLAVGGYHFAGAGDARQEAEYFVNAMRPFEENDVFVLDWEVQHPDPVSWCETFVNRVKELTGVWPLVYMNGSTRNSYNWTRGSLNNCGFWIAWYDRDPEGDLPVNGPYVMHQYTSSGRVPGIATATDLDAWYGTVAQFNKYGWHSTVVVNDPLPPQPTPEPVPEPTPEPEPQPEPTPIPEPTPEPPTKPDDKTDAIKVALLALATAVAAFVTAIAKWISS
jgi:lysozyme